MISSLNNIKTKSTLLVTLFTFVQHFAQYVHTIQCTQVPVVTGGSWRGAQGAWVPLLSSVKKKQKQKTEEGRQATLPPPPHLVQGLDLPLVMSLYL